MTQEKAISALRLICQIIERDNYSAAIVDTFKEAIKALEAPALPTTSEDMYQYAQDLTDLADDMRMAEIMKSEATNV